MAWFLNRALTNFRNEVNEAYPRRDKESDGTIGDLAHANRTSDHNPDPDGSVDAWDMDVELHGRGVIPYSVDIERLKQLFQAHEASSYWIHNDEIARRVDSWERKSYAYAGPDRNRHTQHVHWNTREAYENSDKPWHVEDDMNDLQDKRLQATDARLAAIVGMKPTHRTSWSDVNPNGTEQVLIVQKVLELDGQLTALQARVEVLAGAEAARDAALKALLEQHHAGTLSADAVVAKMGELLSGRE